MGKKLLLISMILVIILSGCDPESESELEPAALDAKILTFSFAAADNAELIADIQAVFSDTSIGIEVPYGTDVSALIPTITISDGASVSPASGAVQSFSTPVMYTVTAADETTTSTYLITVTIGDFQEVSNDFSTTSLQQLESTGRDTQDFFGGGYQNASGSAYWLPQGAAFSEDGGTLVVSSTSWGTNTTGAAFVFELSGGLWSQTAVLTGSLDTYDTMGSSVAISRDGAVIAVGAMLDEAPSLGASGVVHVFKRSGLLWADMSTGTAMLYPSDAASSDYFGNSVAINSDGSVIAVGAMYADAGGAEEGEAYIFLEPSGGWAGYTSGLNYEAAQLKMSASTEQTQAYLGSSIAISEDGSIVAAGAIYYDDTSNNDGAAFVFTEPTGGWDESSPAVTSITETAVLTSSVQSGNEHLGNSISITGDGTTIAVGSEWFYGGGSVSSAGAVLVFKSSGSWTDATEAQLLTAYDMQAADYFGSSVSISSAGGYLICGARGDDLANIDDGSAYLYKLNGGSYTFVSKFGEPAGNAYYGAAVAISPDAGTMCISAPLWTDTNASLTNVGTAYIYK